MVDGIIEQHSGDSSIDEGHTNGSSQRQRSILNIGSELIRDESILDSPVTEGNGNDAGDVDPATVSAADSDRDAPYGRFSNGKPRKRRANGSRGSGSNGSGSGGTTANKRTSATVSINNILFSAHQMLASFTGVSQLMMDEDESKKLAEAITRVTELYDVSVLSAEAMAWTNLAMVAGGIYGPRLMSYTLDKKSRKQNGPRIVTPQMPIPRSAV